MTFWAHLQKNKNKIAEKYKFSKSVVSKIFVIIIIFERS